LTGWVAALTLAGVNRSKKLAAAGGKSLPNLLVRIRTRVFWVDCAKTVGLLLLSVGLLSLAFAPVKQFYLAWVGLVPFFLAIRNVPTQRAAFLWGWFCGIVFFAVNMWWLQYVTLGGAIALMIYLGIFWGIFALLFRGCRLLGRWDSATRSADPPKRPLRCALVVAAVWCGLEWLRGAYSPFGAHGLPWLYLGYTQTPVLALCQIADLAGVYGVSFWIVLVNAVIAIGWIERWKLARIRWAVAAAILVTSGSFVYGIVRLNQDETRPGATVMVVQCNYPQSNTGDKGASIDEIAAFHLHTTQAALEECDRRGTKVDLVVWSETMMPAFNQKTRAFFKGSAYGEFIEQTSQGISDLADQFHTSFLVGSTFCDQWHWEDVGNGESEPIAQDRRNSAYLFGPTGLMSSERYDKIQLLPFGEFIPYRDSIPWLYRLLVSLGPPDMKDYELTAGAPDALTVFPLERLAAADASSTQPTVPTQVGRFVVPICFEDIVPPLVDDLMWDRTGKRADFIVNVTNDGWFYGSERPQHLQEAQFRAIEHRVPIARSVNTGISGFIDSDGRLSDCLATQTEGWSVHQLRFDDRTTLYSRTGDVFAWLCFGVTGLVICYGVVIGAQGRRIRAAG
jgi:apolipoprotein N-acyltransferase